MLVFPEINPIAIQIGPLQIHWYGLMYVIGFLAAWGLALLRARRPGSNWTSEQVSDVIFYSALGVIIGGRLGYMVVYSFPELIANPLSLFKIWQGGMSFHGGLVGVVIGLWFFARRTGKFYSDVADFIAPLAPLGLAAGRLGNFINGEVWGRVTTVPWGMVFPNAGPLPRHPSQLYEMLLEGLLLFTIVWIYSMKVRPRMAVSGVFLIGYGCFRIFCESFRQPDPQLGFLAFHWLTMGQLLSIPMIVIGLVMLLYAYRRQAKTEVKP